MLPLPLLAVLPALVPCVLDVVPVFEALAVLPELSSDELETVAGDELLEATLAVCLLKAGSWPLTSTIAINSHVATNRATAPEIARRRIVRPRPALASRARRARSRAASRSGVLGVMVRSSCSWISSSTKRLISPRINGVSRR